MPRSKGRQSGYAAAASHMAEASNTSGAQSCAPRSDADVKLSKTMSWLLRHGAEKSGFKLQSGGYLYVDEVLSLPQLRNFTLDDVRRVADTNEKKRFTLDEETNPQKPRICANQGHSVEVKDLELEEISHPSDISAVVHGTYSKFWPSIKAEGLKRMNRTHVHFAPGEPGESEVISGMRGSCDILIFLDLALALQDGLKFYRSRNNVLLCPGNEDGIISPKYFDKVIHRKTREEISLD